MIIRKNIRKSIIKVPGRQCFEISSLDIGENKITIKIMNRDINLWGERQRLSFIERVLFWRGHINRSNLIDKFGISPPQATNDLVNYSTLNPAGCRYNVRAKRYEADLSIEPVLVEPDFGVDMQILESAGRPQVEIPFVTTPELPTRNYSREILKNLSWAAHHGESLEIHYFSANSGNNGWRRISPRAFVDDGLRWHVRAYCHQREHFADFNLSRMKEVRGREKCPFGEIIDEDWNTFVTMVIMVNPKLEDNQRKALEMDYGMKRKRLKLPVRKAHLLYTARRMGFIGDPTTGKFPMANEIGELHWVGLEKS